MSGQGRYQLYLGLEWAMGLAGSRPSQVSQGSGANDGAAQAGAFAAHPGPSHPCAHGSPVVGSLSHALLGGLGFVTPQGSLSDLGRPDYYRAESGQSRPIPHMLWGWGWCGVQLIHISRFAAWGKDTTVLVR